MSNAAAHRMEARNLDPNYPIVSPVSYVPGAEKARGLLVTTSPPFGFSNDRPLTDRRNDRLNRGAFADRIAEVLHGLPPGTGLVVGIYGPWGDGKTTVLNLLRANLANNDAIVIHDFNPWRLTCDTAMFRGFFSMLAEAISTSLSTTFERRAAAAGKWSKRLRWITKLIALVSKPTETVDGLLAKFGEFAATADSVGIEELRNRIVPRLEQSVKRIVVLIDDIDRLDKHETHMLFRLVKACADFPNVCYVLAFDDAMVARAIGDRYGGGDEPSGRAFLEKIIQLPLKLPAAAREDLRELCFEQLERVLGVTGIKLTDDQAREFVSCFDRGATIRLTTPRAANRFRNGLMFAQPALMGETNPVDLLLVEALRAFFPEVYDVVRNNHSDFSGVEIEGHRDGDESPRCVELLEPVLGGMPQEHANSAKALLGDLFPRLSGAYEHTIYGTDCLPSWSREQRISAPEYCPRYFTYAIPRDDVADAEVATILNTASHGGVEAIESFLTSHLGGAKARRTIEKLRAVADTVNPIAAKTLAIAIAKHGGLLPNPQALFEFAEPPAQAAILISHLLRRIPNRVDRIAAGKCVLEIAEPLWFGRECLRSLYVTDEPERQSHNTFTRQETAGMSRVLVHRIKSCAANGVPLFDPDLPQEASLLIEWRRTEGREPVQAHLVAVFAQDPNQVARFLHSQAPLTWSADRGLPSVGELGADELRNIEFIIDLNTMAEWVRNHCPGDFDNPEWDSDEARPLERRLAEQFIFVFNELEKDGAPSTAPVVTDDVPSHTEPG